MKQSQQGRKRFRLDGLFLRSAVARRIFALFVLAALTPAIVLVALSQFALRDLAKDALHQQLRGEAINYSRGVYERLLAAHLTLSVHAASLRQGTRLGGLDVGAGQRAFASVELGRTSARMDDATRAHLVRGESVIGVAGNDRAPIVYLMQALDPRRLDKGVVRAALAADYLWGEDDDFSDQMQTCVLTSAKQVLFCSDIGRGGLADSGLLRLMSAADPHAQPYQWEAHNLFLRAHFADDDWTIVALHRQAGAGLPRFAHTALAVIVLTLLLVVFLSVVLIRRTLVPLERLLEGTRRIAQAQFRRPVELEGDDEFGQLGAAFNSMAERVGRQISTMRALSEIDQEILSRVDMGDIIMRVQERLQDLWPEAVSGVVVFDPMAADFGIVHLYSGQDGVTAKLPTRLEPWLMERLARDYDGLWFDVGGTELPDFLTMMVNSGAQRILVLPIYWRDKINGLLAIGLKEPRKFSEEQVLQARNLGNRIGVALAAHARDEELKFRAYHDSLTSLPNRPLLVEHLNQEMAHARRSGLKVAVLLLDLDRFKNINDSMGHEAGDRMLCEVAERLSACVREGDTVARFGGDEFVVLLPGLVEPQQAARLAADIMERLTQPFLLDAGESYIGASIGASVFPDDGSLAPELLKKADMAMHRAKATGRGRLVFFEETMNIAQQERILLERDLRQALADNRLVVHFEPRLRLADGALCGAHALVRWLHPQRGWMAVERVLALAEEAGLMEEIGAWLLHEVCRQLAQWQSAGCQLDSITVNVTSGQLHSGRLVGQVERALQSSGVRARCLELELAEGVLGERLEEIRPPLQQLKRLGVTIAVNNFGTGNAPLDRLQRLPIDVLKISPQLIRDLGRDTSATTIVYSILTLAHALGKIVLAKGVTQVSQADLLRGWGCDQGQGAHFSQPLTAQALEALLKSSHSPA